MSERLFVCLLRLYPSAFREKYRMEALQLYRDRLRDESGRLRRIRLYCDLLADALIGLPQAWRNSYAATSAPLVDSGSADAPLFRLIHNEPLPRALILLGAVFSTTVLFAFCLAMKFSLVMSLSSAAHTASGAAQTASPIESVMQRLNRPVSTDGLDVQTPASTSETAGLPTAQAATERSSTVASSGVSADSSLKLDAAERDRVIHAVAGILVADYIVPAKAREASDSLLARERHGDYDAIADGPAFAERLTEDLQASTHDSHLAMQYSRFGIPDNPPVPSAAERAAYRAEMLRQNCMFEKVQLLPGNVGYIKLNFFPDSTACGAFAHSTMRHLSHADAVIFDLRDNTGGFPDMVAAVAAELFDHPVLWYNPRETPSTSMLSAGQGSTLAHKPVYILTSSRTFSGAEHFTYNLQMLKRATVIGETTRGGHVGTVHRIDAHFLIVVPEARKASSYGKPDWEGIGVEPDIKVNAADALTTAERLARNLATSKP